MLIFLILSIGCGKSKFSGDWGDGIENVIVIAIDTCRANHLGFMGYTRDTSPNLDEFAARSVVFESAYTPRALTLPSFTSLFTGLHTINTHIYQNEWPLDHSLHHLTEDFQAAGYTTVGCPASKILDARMGIGKGFHVYNVPENPPRYAAEEIETMKSEIRNIQGPLFLVYHFWELHSPYEPEPDKLAMFADPDYSGPMDGSVEVMNSYNLEETYFDAADIQHGIDLYDGEIRGLDAHLGDLLDWLDEEGYIDNSLIVITGDHGESLGEGHFFQHLRDSDVELHIPLIFHFPGDRGAGTRLDPLAETMDILPTVMDIVGMDVPTQINGKSLKPFIVGDPPAQWREFVLSVGVQYEDDYLYSIFNGEGRRRVESPVLPPEPVDLTPEQLEHLRSLGYIQ
jgi:arylsulfatase A-like enzyme